MNKMQTRLVRHGQRFSLVPSASFSRLVAYLVLPLIILTVLVACSGDSGNPAQVVETYIEAKAAGDAETIARLLCPEMEADLEREQLTFAGISEVRVEGMACEREGQSMIVQCRGDIIALYGAEETVFPLVSYRVAEEDGEWKWCGEAP